MIEHGLDPYLDKIHSQLDMLYKMCVNIQAHCELDCEVTIEGNGVNPSEAAAVCKGILTILGRKIDKKDLKDRIKELQEEYGY